MHEYGGSTPLFFGELFEPFTRGLRPASVSQNGLGESAGLPVVQEPGLNALGSRTRRVWHVGPDASSLRCFFALKRR